VRIVPSRLLALRVTGRADCGGEICVLGDYEAAAEWKIEALHLLHKSEQARELAGEHENLQAVKESSADIRRVAAIRAILGDRLDIFVGVDDVLVEGVNAGAKGWVAGLVNAFPAESVALFNLARAGKHEEAFALYRWFLPLLRMDTVPKFVQLIKWVQGETGTGSATVRAPRLELHGAELADAQKVLKIALANRPAVKSTAFPSLQEA